MAADRKILLFYDGYELRLGKTPPERLYQQGRRAARYTVRSVRGLQVRTGFYTAFRSLALSLKRAGHDVSINDYDYARAHPRHPIGVAGYPSVLAKLDLPNPAIFGPGDFGPPNAAAEIARDDRYKILTHPSQWFVDLYRPYCGDKLEVMFVGIDTDAWPSLRDHAKTCDFVIYDKIRWFREERAPRVLGRIEAQLQARGLSYTVLRYGAHNLRHFKAALKTCRAMIFVCEHETQGLAYQEALASDVPVLAWDEGEFTDPALSPFAQGPLNVSATPYFDERCGRRFRLAEFERELDAFWNAREGYQPRAYIADHLSMEIAAARYTALYDRLRA